jgi:hypothetical protein
MSGPALFLAGGAKQGAPGLTIRCGGGLTDGYLNNLAPVATVPTARQCGSL